MTSDDTKVDTIGSIYTPEQALKMAFELASDHCRKIGLNGHAIALEAQEAPCHHAIQSLPKVTAERDELLASDRRNTRIYGELKADRDDWRSKADALSARVKDLTEGLGATVTALGHAVDIIEKHVPNDALGTNSAGGGDGWNDQSWPILDEYLHYLKEDLSKARALIGNEPSK